ncbi:MAG: adenylyl-sulfate kinase [Thermoplasmata archaeon]
MPADLSGNRDGFVIWIEGLSGSGKSTLSREVRGRLSSLGWRTEILDGDEVRHMFSPELGFSRRDREFHARRVSYVARMLARNGVAVIVAMITPYETSRQAARSEVAARFVEVWLKCPLEICRQRDPKGIYKSSREGSVKKMTGVDDPFEEPLNPELVVDTSSASVSDCTGKILGYLQTAGLLGKPPS